MRRALGWMSFILMAVMSAGFGAYSYHHSHKGKDQKALI
jgi:hypothetical protein